ncbi:MAG: hypothetical protein ACXWMH_04995 [Syntrophales bacterium]
MLNQEREIRCRRLSGQQLDLARAISRSIDLQFFPLVGFGYHYGYVILSLIYAIERCLCRNRESLEVTSEGAVLALLAVINGFPRRFSLVNSQYVPEHIRIIKSEEIICEK